MQGAMPITDAVYGKRSTRRKPSRKPVRRVAQTLVRDRLAPEVVAELERRFPLGQSRQRNGRAKRRA